MAVLFAVLVSSCGTEKIEAQKVEIDKLTEELAQMQESFKAFTVSQEEKAKTQLDATGIAIVDQGILMEKYEGYRIARKTVERKYNSLIDKAKRDQEDFERKKQSVERTIQHLSEEQQKVEYSKLQNEYNALLKKGQDYEEEYGYEQKKLTEDVNAKVNKHLKKYAETNGYQMVLFTPVENSVFYSKDEINITEEYIQNLNEAYNNGFK